MIKKIIPLFLVATSLFMAGCGKKNTSSQSGSASESQSQDQEIVLELAGQLGEDSGTVPTSGVLIEKEIQGLSVSFTGCYKVFEDGYNIRIYKNKTMTLKAKEITKVEFVCTASGDAQYGPGCLTLEAGGGEYSYSERNGTWAGSSAEITFKAATNQVRAASLKVTFKA